MIAVCSQAPEGAITVRTDGTGATDTTDTAETTDAPVATATEKGTADAIAETGRA